MSSLEKVYLLSKTLLVLSIAAFFGIAAYGLYILPDKIDSASALITADMEATTTQAGRLLDQHAIILEQLLNQHLTSVESSSIKLLDTKTDKLLAIVDSNLSSTSATANNALNSIQPSIDKVITPAAEVLSAANKTLQDTDKTIKDIHPQALGLVAAAKVAAGQTAETARDIQKAVPTLISSTQRIADNSEKATAKDIELHDNAILVMKNLKEDTKPTTLVAKLAVTAGIALLHVFF